MARNQILHKLGINQTYLFDLRHWRHDIGKEGCYVHVLKGPRFLLRDIICRLRGHKRYSGGWKWRLCQRCAKRIVAVDVEFPGP